MRAGTIAVGERTRTARFELERFEWTAPDRLEVAGRWFGIRGLCFMRPALDLHASEDRHRLLALLEHKPWAAEDGEEWVAAFPWEGDPLDFTEAELAVAPRVAVALPLAAATGKPARRARKAKPHKRGGGSAGADGGRSSGRSPVRATGVRAEVPAKPRPEVSGTPTPAEPRRLRADRDAALAARDAARGERDAAVAARDAALRERDEALAARDAVLGERNAALAARDAAVRERDAALQERDAHARDREAIINARNAALSECQSAIAERDEAVAGRDTALRQRDEARRERDELRARQGKATANATEGAGSGVPATVAPWTARLLALGALAILLAVAAAVIHGLL